MELVEHSFSFHASETQMNNTRKSQYFGSVSPESKIMFSQMAISFPWQKYCCTCVCKQVQDKYIPNVCLYCAVLFMIFPSAESEFGILCKIMQ